MSHPGPKGSFVLEVAPEPKSLFEIFCEGLKAAKEEYGVTIPWYVMTSRENNNQTIEFFENNHYFGYPKEAIGFFMQGELPMVDTEGKILLDEEGIIKEAADGHGGVFRAMVENNILKELRGKEIQWVFIVPVDNPLVKMVDEEALRNCNRKRSIITWKIFGKKESRRKSWRFLQEKWKTKCGRIY